MNSRLLPVSDLTVNKLRKIAFCIERYFDAVQAPMTAERTQIEAQIVTWLAHQPDSAKSYVVSNQTGFFLHHQGETQAVAHFALPLPISGKTVWTDGTSISVLDSHAYHQSGQLVMLGADAFLQMRGIPQPAKRSVMGSMVAKWDVNDWCFNDSVAGVGRRGGDNNNNNNNNNNNG